MNPALKKFKECLRSGGLLLGDGAWGTQMQKLGLESGDCPEEWNLTRPKDIQRIATDYFEAGVDFCLSNTFGGNRYRLVRHGFADKVREFNKRGAELSLEVAGKFGGLVAASVGPTGEYVQPEGMLSKQEMLSAFQDQMAALKEGGAEAVCIETMYIIDEALLAIQAAQQQGLFTMACMTFDSTPQGFRCTETTLADATKALDASSADVIGSNCGNGIAEMVEIVKQMRPLTKKPLIVKPNAGLPRIEKGKMIYLETPQSMAARIPELKAAGISIIGGCCGTTPEHIRAFKAQARSGE